jgi:hypothetical protein
MQVRPAAPRQGPPRVGAGLRGMCWAGRGGAEARRVAGRSATPGRGGGPGEGATRPGGPCCGGRSPPAALRPAWFAAVQAAHDAGRGGGQRRGRGAPPALAGLHGHRVQPRGRGPLRPRLPVPHPGRGTVPHTRTAPKDTRAPAPAPPHAHTHQHRPTRTRLQRRAGLGHVCSGRCTGAGCSADGPASAAALPSPRLASQVIKAGATTLNIPDTTGWCLPHEFGKLIADIRAHTPGAENVVISTHCQVRTGGARARAQAPAPGLRQARAAPSTWDLIAPSLTDSVSEGRWATARKRAPSAHRTHGRPAAS